jgi:hypothetical protein
MTVSSTLNRIEYDGNGATALFPFPIYFLAAEDLKVYLRDALGGESLKAHAIDYAISGQGDPAGGAVSFFAPPLPGEKVVILRDPPLTQTTDYQANDAFPAETHERALDKLTMQVQRVAERIDRSVTLEETATDGAGAYDFGGNRIAGVGEPIADGDAATKTYVDAVAGLVSSLSADESFLAIGSAGVGGTANAIVLTSAWFPAAPTGLVKARFAPASDNTGAVTVEIGDGVGPTWGPRPLIDANGDAIGPGALVAGLPVEIAYADPLAAFVLLGHRPADLGGYALVGAGQAWAGVQRMAVEPVAYASSVSPDLAGAPLKEFAALTGPLALGLPVNCAPYDHFILRIPQDAAGSRAITPDPGYLDPPTWSSDPGHEDIVSCLVLEVDGATATKVLMTQLYQGAV